ncbi:MAG: ATP-binding cassette domain-containing protein [Arhodomonas sp.]|nr:ATP-binding cassette domain-containing protein [Arhodomonas sp.]
MQGKASRGLSNPHGCFRSLSVLENLTVAAIGVGEKAAEAYGRACRILEWMGCADKANRPCGELSYGDERRIGIARALATYPSFLLLDEPASGMNESECEDLMRVISEIPGQVRLRNPANRAQHEGYYGRFAKEFMCLMAV